MEKEIIKMLGEVSLVTKGHADARVFKVMASVLSEYPLEDVQGALRQGMKTWEWFPSVAEVVALLKPNHKVKAEESFENVLNHVRRFGKDKPIHNLTDVEKAALRAIGGLSGVGICTDSDLIWKKKAFKETFEEYASVPEHAKKDVPSLTSGPINAKKLLKMP